MCLQNLYLSSSEAVTALLELDTLLSHNILPQTVYVLCGIALSGCNILIVEYGGLLCGRGSFSYVTAYRRHVTIGSLCFCYLHFSVVGVAEHFFSLMFLCSNQTLICNYYLIKLFTTPLKIAIVHVRLHLVAVCITCIIMEERKIGLIYCAIIFCTIALQFHRPDSSYYM